MPTLNTFIEVKIINPSKRGQFVDSINNFVTQPCFESGTSAYLWVDMVLANQPKAVELFKSSTNEQALESYEVTNDGMGLKVKDSKHGALFLSSHLTHLKDLGVIADYKSVYTTSKGKLDHMDAGIVGYYIRSNIE